MFTPGGGDVPEWAEVAAHRGEYAKGDLPTGAVFLVMTVDVQISRIYYVIRGWGARATSWLIDWGTLFGETVEEAVWTDLADLVATPVCGRPLRLVLIDSGFRPGKVEQLPLNRIYDFCRRFPRHVRPTKGASSPMRVPLIKSAIEVTPRGKSAKYGLELLRLDSDYFKSWVFERVRWPDDEPGAWHLPHDVDDDYCRQIVSESRMRLPSGRVRWVQRSKENHYLDCEAMQAAASHLINAGRIREGAKPAPPLPAGERETGELHEAFVAAQRKTPFLQRRPGWIGARGDWMNRR